MHHHGQATFIKVGKTHALALAIARRLCCIIGMVIHLAACLFWHDKL
jgi:hypothetical protein